MYNWWWNKELPKPIEMEIICHHNLALQILFQNTLHTETEKDTSWKYVKTENFLVKLLRKSKINNWNIHGKKTGPSHCLLLINLNVEGINPPIGWHRMAEQF